MELSNEDALRLNVLVVNAKAVRIDEHNMTVYGLTDEGELKVPLSPNTREEQYLIRVREMLSSQALGSPRGYPVYLHRWARMGQISNSPLDKLLMLGEPEAVVAVACAPDLTNTLAEYAWWCSPTAEIAQRLLENESVANGSMGSVLAAFLLEFLPFETEPDAMLCTVRLILKPGLLSEQARSKLWETGSLRKAYRVAFLEACPNDIPRPLPPRADWQCYTGKLTELAARGNAVAALLQRLLEASGQTFLAACQDVMRRPMHQDIVAALFNAMAAYFSPVRQFAESCCELDEISDRVDVLLGSAAAGSEIGALRTALPELGDELRAALLLSHVNEAVLTPIFVRSDAMGTLLRRKIAPITAPVDGWLTELRTARG